MVEVKFRYVEDIYVSRRVLKSFKKVWKIIIFVSREFRLLHYFE